jgi:hypothetical protein
MPSITLNTGIIDTRLEQANPATSFAAATKVGVDTNADVQALLAFTGLFGSGPSQIPLGATITSATLTLQTTNGSSQGGSLHRMLIPWTTVPAWTWDSFGNGIQFDDREAVAAADLVTGAVAIGSRAFDVTNSVQAWAAGAANHGWGFEAGGTDGWDFYSSEGTTKPILSVTYTTDTTLPVLPVAAVSGGFPNPQTEGANATIRFTITLDRAASDDVVVNYATVDGTATAANDFLGVTSGSITFAAGQTSKAIDIMLRDDAIPESAEAFALRLISATNATLSLTNAVGTGNIADNDSGPPSPVNPTVVRIHDTTKYKAGDPSGFGSGDPSGLAYVPTSDTLFIADSEHDESPYFSPTNLFAVRPDGTFIRSFSLASFTTEPTGLAYNSQNGFLYITDDDKDKMFWVNPAAPSVKLGEFSTRAFGTDAEDPKFDPDSGHMFMLDGTARRLFELTTTGGLVRSVLLPSAIADPEALAYDSVHDVFYVGGGFSSNIWRIDHAGHILATIDVLADFRNPDTGVRVKPKGLELAPSSDPNDGGKLNLFVADYGVDQRNDGRLFEIDLGTGWLLA